MAAASPEMFICIFSTFCGVVDIGISAFLGTNAFNALMIQGILSLVVGRFGVYDWYICGRDIITYLVVVLTIALMFLDPNISWWNPLILLGIYGLYIIFMKFNKPIEKYIRNYVRLRNKFKPKEREHESYIKRIQLNPYSRFKLAEIQEENYTLQNGILTVNYKGQSYPQTFKLYYPKKPTFELAANCVNKIRAKIICKEVQIKRDAMDELQSNYHQLFPKSNILYEYNFSDDEEGFSSKKEHQNNEPNSQSDLNREGNDVRSTNIKKENAEVIPAGENPEEEVKEEEKKIGVIEEIKPPTMKDKSIQLPQGFFPRLFFIISFPIRGICYVTIPDPEVERKQNITPVIFFICLLWVGLFSYFITWWLLSLTVAFNIEFLDFQMIILPIGLLIRDMPVFFHFREETNKCKEELEKDKIDFDKIPDERKVKIPESYSNNIFQIAVGSSIPWLIKALVSGDIQTSKKSTYVQFLLLFSAIFFKFIVYIILSFEC